MTAQEAFTRMIKAEVAPALRRLGFKGSGQRYELPSKTHWAVVGFQRSTSSDAKHVKFTINATVVSREEWERASNEQPWLGKRPSANARSSVGWEARIGGVMPNTGGDHWWSVTPGSVTEPVAGEVVGAVRDYLLPAMRARMDRTDG